jgi:hypothetical protein
MEHPGPLLRMRSNCGRASAYQKSCNRATPRLKLACTAGAEETVNETVPRRSPVSAGTAASGACEHGRASAHAAATVLSHEFILTEAPDSLLANTPPSIIPPQGL